jgi:NADH-quinone oxidoreductase subunit J
MTYAFYIASIIALAATVRVVTGAHAVHSLLYLVVSLLASAVVFLTLGAAFAAALEVIVYAGAIMVLFVFVMMMLSSGPRSMQREKRWLAPQAWLGPAVLAAILLAELTWLLLRENGGISPVNPVAPGDVGRSLFGPYVLGVEMASVLLLAGLIGANHLGRRLDRKQKGGNKR